MKLPTVLVALALLALAAIGHSQQPPPPVLLPLPRIEPKPVPFEQPIRQLAQNIPADPTVDQMLDGLESLRTQKAELEKKERETVEAINKKVESQSERMRKLGIGKDKTKAIFEILPSTPQSPEIPIIPHAAR